MVEPTPHKGKDFSSSLKGSIIYMSSNAYQAAYNKQAYHRRVNLAKDKLGGKCIRCGSTENLEIDHINEFDKSYTISYITRLSLYNFLKELKKCQLLCNPCHKEKTFELTSVGHGEGITGKRNCRCRLCAPLKKRYMQLRKQIKARVV